MKEIQKPLARRVRVAADLPDHDLILDLEPYGFVHIRHYVNNGEHVVIAGQLKDGIDPIGGARIVAREASETVIPAGREFTLIAYTPQRPLSPNPHFHEVTFELGQSERRPSTDLFKGDRVTLPSFKALDLAAVESLTGRPVLNFPEALYTRRLAEAMNGQPAKRLFELLIDAGLACPTHGPSPDGEYCGSDPKCEEARNYRERTWRTPYRPHRHSTDGAYVGAAGPWPAHIEFVTDERRHLMPIFDLEGPEVAWGYGGSGAHEAAICILADYLGFLPRRQLRASFVDDVVSGLPSEGFSLPIADIDDWFDVAARDCDRGLVLIAAPPSSGWFAGQCNGIAGWVGQGLLEIGCDVYEPGLNANIPAWKKKDRRLHGMLHTSLLAALDACSMIVIPYDGEAIAHNVEGTTALRYALCHPEVATLIAYARAEESHFTRISAYGVKTAPVGEGIPRDVSAVLEAVDRACAAYECLRAMDRQE